MPRRKIIANVAGLVAAVIVAWSVHGLMAIGSCGGEGMPVCPPELAKYVVGVFVGAFLAIGSAIGGGFFSMVGVFLAVGVGAIWAGLDKPDGEGSGAVVMGAIFIGVALLPVLALPVLMVTKRKAVRLVTEGAPAIATVLDVQDTGTTINKNPRVRMKLRITPQDGSEAFEGEKAAVVPRLALPRPGHRYPAWYDRTDRTKFVIATDVAKNAPAEMRRLFEVAQAESVTAQSHVDPLDRLAQLNELRMAGALTEDEFAEQKRKILDEA